MGKVTLIKPTGEVEVTELAGISLTYCQQQVGGWIEVVPRFSRYSGEPCIALCDKEGKLKAYPLNENATQLWREQLPFYLPDVLVGNILIIQGDLMEQF